MSLPAQDQFTDPDETPLTTHSASWTLCSGNFEIRSNAVRGSVAGECGAGWNADPFEDDQYAQGTIVSMQDYYIVGIGIRSDVSTPSANYYAFYGTHNASWLYKIIGGADTQLGSDGPGFTVDDVIRIEVEGTTIRCKINGVTQIEATDSDIASGAAALSSYGYGAETLLDDWEGGNLAGGPVARSIVVVIG